MICSLANKHCGKCSKDSIALDNKESNLLLSSLEKGWAIKDKTLLKSLKFKSFKEAIAFIDILAILAEAEGHHPDIHLHHWNKIDITLSTHAIKDLTENDFIIAAKIDQVYKQMIGS